MKRTRKHRDVSLGRLEVVEDFLPPPQRLALKRRVDLSRGRRGAVITNRGKTRVTIYLDNAIISYFRGLSERTGKGYQTLINDALAGHMADSDRPVTASEMRRIPREELRGRKGG
jgi:uncharacterized protein (DUF4415 family)